MYKYIVQKSINIIPCPNQTQEVICLKSVKVEFQHKITESLPIYVEHNSGPMRFYCGPAQFHSIRKQQSVKMP